MTVPEGGLRDRFVFESFAAMVHDCLAALGWFDAGRQHTPLTWSTVPTEDGKPVLINTIEVSSENLTGTDAEIGSNLSDDTTQVWVDIYAENDALGQHLAGDVRDILRGKMSSINRDEPVLMVLDMSMAAPRDELFYVEIDNVTLQRSHMPVSAGQRHWYAVSADLIESR